MAELTINITIEDEAIMDAVFDNLFTTSSPWLSRYSYAGFHEDSTVECRFVDYDDNVRTEVVAPQNLADGLGILLRTNQRHCSGVAITADIEQWDTCVSDMVLQAAIYGDVVYG